MLQTERIGVLLRRARLLLRYSEMVVNVLPLVAFGPSPTRTTTAIRALRSLILPIHKSAFVKRVLDAAKALGSSAKSPSFKISRAHVLSGRPCASDGSDSIAFQIFNNLKESGAHISDDLYRAKNESWWKVMSYVCLYLSWHVHLCTHCVQVTFRGEGGQDAGGLFRESIGDIANDFMSDRTPLFLRVPNHDEHIGSFSDTFVPNPRFLCVRGFSVDQFLTVPQQLHQV